MTHPRILLGIGNPGVEYLGTRHNVGFDLVERLAGALNLRFAPAPGPALEAHGGEDEHAFVLFLPQAYVNRSGEALAARFGSDGLDPTRLLVVVDDVALAPGRLRLRAKGSSGGHNGLRSLARALGTEDYPRLRVGVGAAPPGGLVAHVLGRFDAAERELVDQALDHAQAGVREWLRGTAFPRCQEQVHRTSPPALVRRTGSSGSAASAAPNEPAARGDQQGFLGDLPVEQKLNKYEGMFVLNPSRLAADELQATTVVTELVEKYGGKPVRIDVWDEQRKLAYPIDDQKRGTYVLAHFEAEGETPDSVSKAVNINEVVMRWLCTRHQETFPEFKVASEMEGARRRDGDREGGRKSDGDAPRGDGPKSDAPKADAPAGDAAPAAEVKDSAPAGDGEDQGDTPSA